MLVVPFYSSKSAVRNLSVPEFSRTIRTMLGMEDWVILDHNAQAFINASTAVFCRAATTCGVHSGC